MADILQTIYLPCGGIAHFDHESGCSYRCGDCMATVGSMGQPKKCKEAVQYYDMLKSLGFKTRWDYTEGCEEEEA